MPSITKSSIRAGISFFLPVAGAIILAWWWLGQPVEMPASPLTAGQKLYCVSYTPFRGDETPLDVTTHIDPERIEEDFTQLAHLTDCVRTYSTNLGLDRVAEIAGRHGLKVIQGIWLGRDGVRNRREIETGVALAKRYPNVIRALVVGNEVLLRGELSPTDLAGMIRQVKMQVSVPVTYADVWEFWLRYREVYDAVDFVTIHVLPYWEDFPIPASEAAAHIGNIRRLVAARFPDKEILIGEAGWPSAGRMREGALPSPANQARVIQDLLALAEREKFHVNVIEAFDQPWKRKLEGTVGGHWGFLDGASRDFKFAWGAPISNHPNWRQEAGMGVAFAAAIFAAGMIGWMARKSSPDMPAMRIWSGVALTALICGTLVGWSIEAAVIESFGLGGSLVSLAMLGIAIAVPLAAGMALMRGASLPAFAHLLARRTERPCDGLTLVLGLLLIVTSALSIIVALGLVFDPRYRDFPFTALTAASTPFFVLTLFGVPIRGRRGIAEYVSAALLAGSAIYIAINETFANWQALWLCASFLILAFTLVRVRDARNQE